jgi:hypothetical protein
VVVFTYFVICGCVYVWVLLCVGVCMYGVCNVCMCGCMYVWCFDNCEGVLVICVLVFTVFLYCFVYVYLLLFVTSVMTTATEWKLSSNI